MRGLLFIVILVSALLSLGSTVIACGGYEVTSIDRMVEFSELVVSARVDYVDDLGENAILQVDRYFKGNGGEYVAVVGTRPAAYYADSLRDYSNGCFNIGPYGFKFEKDEVGYYALQSNGDGTYGYYYESVWIPGNVLAYRTLESTEGLVEFYLSPRSEHEFETPAPEEEFEKLLLQLGDANGTTPPAPNPYPLKRYLNITTETGERYRLNPDRSVSWIDPAKSPIAISNDGSHVMFRLEYDELGFQYLERIKKGFHPCAYCEGVGSAVLGGGRAHSSGTDSVRDWLHPVEGWYARFSPDSNFVAVQERKRLVIYMLNNWWREPNGYGQHMGMPVVAGQTVWWDPFWGEEPMEWSADSTTLAFQGERGIWHWDLFEETHPRLILPGDRSKRLLDISRSGRYVRYSDGESWNLIHTKTGATFEKAISTPDERNVIHIQSSFPKGTEIVYPGQERDFRHVQRTCHAPLAKCPISIQYRHEPIDIFEYQPGWIGLVSRSDVSIYPWYLAAGKGRVFVFNDFPMRINAFDYDGEYSRPAVVLGEFTIDLGYIPNLSINMAKKERADLVNLREHLDSPIVEVEWGQPVFLDRL